MQLEINNITLHYTQEGTGQPLILLHGNGEDHSIFAPLTKQLSNHFTVYAIDSRNHGKSSKTDDFAYKTMAEDITQFVQKLELRGTSVVGFSDGAIIAALIEIANPNMFNKMALLGINLKPSDFKPENIEYLKEEYEKTNDPLFKMMLEEPNIELSALKAITCPTLVVKAEDELFVDELYENIVTTLPNAQLLEMKGHDHASYIVENDALYADLLKFF